MDIVWAELRVGSVVTGVWGAVFGIGARWCGLVGLIGAHVCSGGVGLIGAHARSVQEILVCGWILKAERRIRNFENCKREESLNRLTVGSKASNRQASGPS
ncbi:hypothetical protein CIPAW_07G168900 [Carya illinoinensis]|uniref:Uncharacterized protein n=1 Tax=Carya illinoinensis TaxID=32201 RepID=A0A8T1Q325_CARIL|nr:hypothetical protein CIPAW_07G168900 [Carya illinoinensis]